MKRKLLLILATVTLVAVACAAGCKSNTTAAHTVHKGGTATCTQKAVCSECGKEYGELDPTNHASTEFAYVTNGNGTHKKTNACCGATVEASVDCSGGTATCSDKAKCAVCNGEYGELAPGNHTYTEVDEKVNYYGAGVKAHYACKCGKKFLKNGDTYTEVSDANLATAQRKLQDYVIDRAVMSDVAENDYIAEIIHLETASDPTSNKIKVFDQNTPNYVKTTDKDGNEIVALYFTKETAITSAEDSSKNYGNSEFRIAYTGKITKISFDYRLVDFNNEKCLTLDKTDKGYGMKSFLEYKHSGTYENMTKTRGYGDTFFNADGEWHHVEFACEQTDMKAILFKIYHFQGEFMVTNVIIE